MISKFRNLKIDAGQLQILICAHLTIETVSNDWISGITQMSTYLVFAASLDLNLEQ
jgi:hypothetical protein